MMVWADHSQTIQGIPSGSHPYPDPSVKEPIPHPEAPVHLLYFCNMVHNTKINKIVRLFDDPDCRLKIE